MKKLVTILLAAMVMCSALTMYAFAEETEVSTDLENEKLNELCDLIIKAVVKDDMTDVEKAYAVYTWVDKNLKYKGQDNYEQWQDAAYDSLSNYSGDCLGYYAATRALLQRMGFETMQACSEDESHCWVMAKIGDFWWHLDNTPGWGGERFMLTTDELLDFEYIDNEKYPDGLKYDFNPEGYPETKGTDKDRELKTEGKQKDT